MLNVIIVLNDKEKSFDVKWIMNKEDILVVGKDYCPCCYYRLNNNKNKVKKLIGNLFSESVIDGVSIKKVHEYYRLFLMDELNVNIVVSKEIIDEIKKALSGIPKDEITEEPKKSDVENLFEEVFKKPLFTPEEKAVIDTKEKLVNEMDMMFKIMTAKVNFTRKDLYNEDGTRRSIEEVYQITQDKLKDNVLKGDENSTKEESDELKKVINFMLSPDPRFEALKKVNEYFAKLAEAIGKPDEVKISKPVKDEQEKSVDNKSVLSKILKTATYDLTNKDNRLTLTLGNKIFMFNNIHVYYREGDVVKRAYLNIDQNGNFNSTLSFVNFENLLKNNVFYHINNLDQIKFLKDIFPSMPGMMEDNPDIVLYKSGEGFPVNFPDIESLYTYNNEVVYQMVTNFYTFLPISQFKDLIVKKGMEKRTEELVDTKHNENKETGRFGESLNLRDVYVDINTESEDLTFSTLLPIKDKLFFTVDKSSDNGIGCLELLDKEFLKISSLENNPLINNYYLTKEVCDSFVETGCGFTESNFLPIKKDENILYVKVHKGKLISTVTPQVANKFYMISYEQSPDEIMKIRKYFRSIGVINNLSTLSHKEIDSSKFLITKSALAILSKSEEWSHIKFEEYK